MKEYERLFAPLSHDDKRSKWQVEADALRQQQAQTLQQEAQPTQQQATQDKGYLDQLIDSTISGGAGVYGNIGSMVHADDTADYFYDVAERNREQNPIAPALTWEYITNPRGLTRSTGEMLGSVASLAPAALLAPEGAVGAGVGLLGRLGVNRLLTGLIGNGAVNGARIAAANRIAQAVPMGVRWALGTSGLESLAEGGGSRREALQEGLSESEATKRSLQTAALNLPTLIGSNLVEGTLGLGGALTIPARVGAGTVERIATAPLRGLLNATVTSTQQGAEEGLQRGISDYVADKPYGVLPWNWTEGQWDEAKEGFAGSLLFGGAGSTINAARQQATDTSGQGGEPPQQSGLRTDALDDSIDYSGVDLTGTRPETMAMINRANQIYQQLFGRNDFWVSATTGGHSEGTPHALGYKADVGGSALKESAENRKKFQDALQAEGIGANNEYDHPSENSTAGHFDLDVRGKNWYTGENFGGFRLDGATQQGGKRTGHANAWAIYDVFKQAGYNDTAIAGILGRVQQEHNFETSNVPEYEAEGKHLGGYGMFQWNGGRTTAFTQWAEANGLDPQNATVQAQYALQEAMERGLTPDKMNNLSAEDAATLWTDEWEVGEHGEEKKYANEWLERIRTGGSAGTTTNTQSSNTPTVDIPNSNNAREEAASDKFYEELANYWKQTATGENVNFFEGFFNEKGKFQDTPENRQLLDEAIAQQPALLDEFNQWKAAQQQRRQQNAPKQSQAKSAQNTPQIDIETASLDDLKDALRQRAQTAIQGGDFATMTAINTAFQTNDEQSIRNLARQLLPRQQAQQPIPAPIQQAAPTQEQPVFAPTQETGGIQNESAQTQNAPTPESPQTAANQNQNAQPEQTQGQEVTRQAPAPEPTIENIMAAVRSGQLNPQAQQQDDGAQTMQQAALNTLRQLNAQGNATAGSGLDAANNALINANQQTLQQNGLAADLNNLPNARANGTFNPNAQAEGDETNSMQQAALDAMRQLNAENAANAQANAQAGSELDAANNSLANANQRTLRQNGLAQGNAGRATPAQVTKGRATPYHVQVQGVSTATLDRVTNKYKIVGYYHNGQNATVYFDSQEDSQNFAQAYANGELNNIEGQATPTTQPQQQEPESQAQEATAQNQETLPNGNTPTSEQPQTKSNKKETEYATLSRKLANLIDIDNEQGNTEAAREKYAAIVNHDLPTMRRLAQEPQDSLLLTMSDVAIAMAEPKSDKANSDKANKERQAQIEAILRILENPSISQYAKKPLKFSNKLTRDLRAGKSKAIRYAQNLLREAGIPNLAASEQAKALRRDILARQKQERQANPAPKKEQAPIESAPQEETPQTETTEEPAAPSQEITPNNETVNEPAPETEAGMAELVESQGDPNQISLMGESGKASLMEIIERSREDARDSDASGNLFAQGETTQPTQKSPEQSAEQENHVQQKSNEKEATQQKNGEAQQDTAPKAKNAKEGQSTPTPKSERISNAPNEQDWGVTEEDNIAELEKILGKKRKSKSGKPKTKVESVNNPLMDSVAKYDDQLDDLLAAMQKKLNRISANPVFDPEIYELGAKIGLVYIRRGYRTFSAWAKHMLETIGEKVNPWLKSIWQGITTMPEGKAFDETKLRAMTQFVGLQYRKGLTSQEEIANSFRDTFDEETYNENKAYLNAAYQAVSAYYNPDSVNMEGATKNEPNERPGTVAERTGEGVNQDGVGRNDENGLSGRNSEREGLQEIGTEVRSQGSVRVRAGRAADSGETGNSRVQIEEPADNADSPGSVELSGSVRDSLAGRGNLDDGRKAESLAPSQNRQIDATTRKELDKLEKELARLQDEAKKALASGDKARLADIRKQWDIVRNKTENKFQRATNPNIPHKAGDLESIKNDLPMLLPEQQEDVQFIEERLLVNGKTGVLLTNGTGTGKTYSGLGMVKRFHDAGKKNILIVVPSGEVAKQWSDAAAKDFGLTINQLESVKDAGKGVCVTTYANFQQNRELVKREWDAVIADESHNLMQNEKGEKTGYLDMLRTLTLHPRNFRKRFEALKANKQIRAWEDELDQLYMKQAVAAKAKDKAKEQMFAAKIDDLNAKIGEAYSKMNAEWKAMQKELEALPAEKRPKVLFLSATPFAYDKDVDYAEGYLFDYPADSHGYNAPGGQQKFMIENFGYRMRYNKLTRPDAQVDNRIMEVAFHDKLVNEGAMRGRQLKIDADYDRGFLLVDGGIGTKIDEGFSWLWKHHEQYKELYDALRKQFNRRAQRYLLESIKAKAAVPIVREYIKQGKKVVLFHKAMQEKMNVHPFQLDSIGVRTQEEAENIRAQYEKLKKERPDLVNMNFKDLPSPMATFRNAFGEEALYIDGSAEHKKGRATAQKLFNDDNSGKNLIICQQDAANAGVSLHDTTGKHQRVLINIAMPERPSYAMQIEGRIYRVGNVSNAIIRYLATGTDMEKTMFAQTIGGRAATVENLAQGNAARALRDSFVTLYQETMDGSWERRKPGHPEEGTGGKEIDSAIQAELTDWDRAKSFYFAQQKKTSRTKAQEGNDYFATPEPIGLKMVEWLGLNPGDSVMEPSAGHGAISRWFSPNTKNTIVEPSGQLAPLAQMVTPEAKVVHGRFEDFNVVNKFDGIAMNPPFGHGGKTAVDHIAKAFNHLSDGGRLVAIMPEGSSADAHFNKWMYGEDKNGKQVQKPVKGAVLTATIRLPGVTFGRAGTSVATKIVVIDKQMDKTKAEAANSQGGREIDLRGAEDINDLFDRMENMAMPERITAESRETVNTTENTPRATPQETPAQNFTTGDFTHTKTGKQIPQAKLTRQVEREEYQELASLAKKHGGFYSKFSKSFLFESGGERGRDAFVAEAEGVLGSATAQEQVNLHDVKWLHLNRSTRPGEAAYKRAQKIYDKVKNYPELWDNVSAARIHDGNYGLTGIQAGAWLDNIINASDSEIANLAAMARQQNATSKENSSGAKFSLDSEENLTDNERRALDHISDDMSFSEARSQLLGERNRKTATVLNIFNRAYKAGKNVTQRIRDLFRGLKEARDDAQQARSEYTTIENVRNLERLLRDRGLLGEGSYLAKDIQRVLDALGTEGDNGGLAEEIPGEYAHMYDRIAELEKKLKLSLDNTKHSEKGAFSIAENGAVKVSEDVETNVRKALDNYAKMLGGKYNKTTGQYEFSDDATGKRFQKISNALWHAYDPVNAAKYSITAWHGTPHDFERFSLQAIGTGEGAQVHGWGLYFAGSREVSEGYRERLSEEANIQVGRTKYYRDYNSVTPLFRSKRGKILTYEDAAQELVVNAFDQMHTQEALTYLKKALQSPDEDFVFGVWGSHDTLKKAIQLIEKGKIKRNDGTLFQVEIPDADVLLDEDLTFEEQPEKVQKAIRQIVDDFTDEGQEKFVKEVEEKHGKSVADTLREYISPTPGKEFNPLDVLLGKTKTEREILEELPDGKDIITRADRIKDAKWKIVRSPRLAQKITYITSSKSGRAIYGALSEMFGGDKAASELLNKHGIKGITYIGGRDGRCYVVFDDQAIDIVAKFSADAENARKLLKTLAFADPTKLNKEQARLEQMGEEMGVTTVWFDGDPKLNGFHSKEVTFLNRKGHAKPLDTFWHESFHWIKANNRGLARELVDAVQEAGIITPQQIKRWQDNKNRHNLSDAETIEEIIADEFINPAKFHDLANKINKSNPSLVQRLVAWIKKLADRFIEMFQGSKPGVKFSEANNALAIEDRVLTTAQRDNLIKAVGRLAGQIKDENGRPVFKVEQGGKVIKLADGKALPEVEIAPRFSAITGDSKEIQALRAKYQGTAKWLKAPNGKKTNLTEEQWLNVRTTAFKKWFGDWENDPANASKVVDENGEPLVVYHGSNRRFNTFKKGDLGFHLGTQEQAEVAAEGQVDWTETGKARVISVFANIRNPMRIDYDPETWNDMGSNFMHQLRREGIISEKEFKKLNYDGLSYARMHPIREKLQAAGYDGVIYPNWYEFRPGNERRTEFDDSFIALSANQIKSATDNVGTYDTANDDIRFSFAGEKSKTAPLDTLAKAKEMDGEASENTIWTVTGWIKGKDGKWRYEIPDNLDKIDFKPLEKLTTSSGILSRLMGKRYRRLPDIYDNEQLYEAYPSLRNLPVSVFKDGQSNASYDPQNNLIKINTKLVTENTDDAKTSLLHEIQHAIQYIEGFATGGNIRQFIIAGDNEREATRKYLSLGGEQEAREVQERAPQHRTATKYLVEAQQKYDDYKNSQPKQIQELMDDAYYGNNDDAYDALPEDAQIILDDLGFADMPLSTPTIHSSDAIIVFGGQEFAAMENVASKATNSRKYSIRDQSPIEKGKGKNDNKGKIADHQKETLFNTLAKHIDTHIATETREHKNGAEVARELLSENSRHRARILGAIRLSLNDFQNHKNDADFRQMTVKRILHDKEEVKDWDTAKIKEAYDEMIAEMKEVVDYAGVLYHEIAIDRERAQRNPTKNLRVLSWTDAESQRAEREDEARKALKNAHKQNRIREISRSEEDGFSHARTIAELKTEAKEAFPNAKITERGNDLIMTMPNGQKVTVTLSENINATEEELADARKAHGISQGASVTIEGYAETVNGEGFINLAQGSRKGTGFHEAYHIAEAMAFTQKELADAKRLISANDEVRADKYAEWVNNRKKNSNFAKLWRKIQDTAAKLAKMLGVETQHNLFRQVESGAIYERENQGRDTGRRYSANENGESEQSWLDRVSDKFAKALHLKGDRIITETRQDGIKDSITLKQYIVNSPSRIAAKVQTFKHFFTMGERAMAKLTNLRNSYQKKYAAAMDTVKKKEDRENLFKLLLTGDMEGKEYGELTEAERENVRRANPSNHAKAMQEAKIDKIMREAEVSRNVADAYLQVRRLMTKAYHMLNEARRKPQYKSEHLSPSQIDSLRENKFVEIMRVSQELDEKGRQLVTYKEYANHKREYKRLTQAEVDSLQSDPAIDVIEVWPIESTAEYGELLYNVRTREGIPDITRRKGYIPHFFHEYMIRVVDAEGKPVDSYGYGGVITSGRTQREAVKLAEEWQKEHQLKDGEQILIAPKAMDFRKLGMKESDYAPIMGDQDFDVMTKNLAKANDMTIAEAKEMMNGAVKLKNRHRFYGNLLQRKGAKGYEDNMAWVLRHYFNTASRYAALESEFKPKAISLFERLFGAFDKDYDNQALAKYTKQFINDINGNPSTLETMLNEWFNKSTVYRNFFVPTFGERAALGMTNAITSRVSYLTLGMFNLSSSLLNFTQLINSTAYLGSPVDLMKYVGKGAKGGFNFKEMRVLAETGVLGNIGLDSGSGYDQNRGYSGSSWKGLPGLAIKAVDRIGNTSMKLFTKVDMLCRIGTVLAAYDKARAEGKNHDEAISYAKDINRKANFDYGVNDAPNIFRRGSIISQLALQFKKYGFKELEVISDFMPTSKKTSTKQKMLFWGLYFTVCGLLGIPFLEWLDDLFGERTGLYPKDFIQKSIMEICGDSPEGKTIASMLMYGGLAAANINMSQRASLADVIPTRTGDLAGATLSKTYNATADTMKYLFGDGNGAQIVRDFSPGIYNLIAAYEGESRGQRDRLNTRYETTMDRLLRAMGFKSVEESLPGDIQRIASHERSQLTKEKQRAIDAYIKDPSPENRREIKRLGIKKATIEKERKRKAYDRRERAGSEMNKSERERYKDMLEYMN